jgi:hypothetical protein
MNRDRAKEWIPIFKAFSDGTGIQERTINSGWTCAESIDVTMSPSYYRIKPEPEVIYVNKLSGFCGGQARHYSSELEANKAAPLGAGSDYEYIAKKFIEAAPENTNE